MRVLVLGSGSTGNSALVEAGGVRVLVDAGFGPKSAVLRLRLLGADLFPRGVDAIVVTHQHGDHIAHLEPLSRALRCPVYLHSGIEAKRVRTRFDVREYGPGASFSVGAMAIDAVSIPHDSPQVALRFTAQGASFGIATDLGAATRDLIRLFSQCDSALLEANHRPELLWNGSYPQRLKRRVAGDLGHLSNEQAAEIARKLVGTRLRSLFLGHLSRSHNTPELAVRVVQPRAQGIDVRAIPHGVPVALRVTPRGQLALPFG